MKLLEYFYSLPSEFKYRNGIGRYIFRGIVEGEIPDKIRMRVDKSGATVPNLIARLSLDENKFMEIIDEGKKTTSFTYLDYQKLVRIYNELVHENGGRKLFGPTEFLSSISILILQRWQREGKINFGIKC